MVIAFELEITFRTAKCRFSPPHINGSLPLVAWTDFSLSHLCPSMTRVKLKIFGVLGFRSFGAALVSLQYRLNLSFCAKTRDPDFNAKQYDNIAEHAVSHPLRRG